MRIYLNVGFRNQTHNFKGTDAFTILEIFQALKEIIDAFAHILEVNSKYFDVVIMNGLVVSC